MKDIFKASPLTGRERGKRAISVPKFNARYNVTAGSEYRFCDWVRRARCHCQLIGLGKKKSSWRNSEV